MTAFAADIGFECVNGVWRSTARKLIKDARALLSIGNNGGVLGPRNIPTTSAAPGVWTLEEARSAKLGGIWPAVVTFTPTTWSASDKAAGMTLTGSNLIATRTSASGTTNGVRSVAGNSASKLYAELTYTLISDQDDLSFGIANSSAGLTTKVGGDANGWGVTKTSPAATTFNKYTGGSATAMTPTATTASGDKFMIAHDGPAGKVWFGRNGTWFDSGDPAAGTNPQFTGLTGTLYLMFSTLRQNDAMTLNAGGSAFTYTVPSGYTAGWG